MELKTRSVIRKGNRLQTVDIFGYSTNGVPGLEIVGLGPEGRTIKEKFIFLTRFQKLKLPLKRFLIGVEIKNISKKASEYSVDDLEIPMLIIYWALAGCLQIRNLESCWSTGKISIDFKFSCPLLDELEKEISQMRNIFEDPCLIIPERKIVNSNLKTITLEKLLEQVKREENIGSELYEESPFQFTSKL